MRAVTVAARPRPRFLVTITRKDEAVSRLTNSQGRITVGSETWEPCPGVKLGDITERNDGTTPITSLAAFMEENGPFDPDDVNGNLFEDVAIQIYFIDAAAPRSPDPRSLWFDGIMKGGSDMDLGGSVSFTVVSKFAEQRDIFVRQYGIPCDADFGDPRRCKMPTWPDREVGSSDLHDVARGETIAIGDRRRFDYDATETPDRYHNVYWEATGGGTTGGSDPVAPSDTPGGTVSDGSVTWTVRNAYVRWAQIATVNGVRSITLDEAGDSRAASDDTWYAPGRIKVCSGFYKGWVFKVSAWNSATLTLTLVEPVGLLLAVNDWLEIAPDCDKTLDMCVFKYDNANNYRGFPHLTGDKTTTSTVIPGVTPDTGPSDDPGLEGEAVEFPAGDD